MKKNLILITFLLIIGSSNILLSSQERAQAHLPAYRQAWTTQLIDYKKKAKKLKAKINQVCPNEQQITPRCEKAVKEGLYGAKNILYEIHAAIQEGFLPAIMPREVEIAKGEINQAVAYLRLKDKDVSTAKSLVQICLTSIMRLGTKQSREIAQAVPGPKGAQEIKEMAEPLSSDIEDEE